MNQNNPYGQSGIQYDYQSGSQPSHTGAKLGSLAPKNNAPVKDISTAEFMSEVIEASQELPVIVDFWAPWCGPCKQLAPVLEKVVAEADGAVKLVKMNIDEHPEVAGQMGVQSIPAVVSFKGGRPAEAFMGAKSESEIRQFVQKLGGPKGPSELDMALEQAVELKENGSISEARSLYEAILGQLPDNLEAIVGLGTICLEEGDLEGAKEMLSRVNSERLSDQIVVSFQAAIDLSEQANAVGDLAPLEEAIEQNPKDFQARYDLAIALNGMEKREEAAEQLLYIIKTDRKWNDDGAKSQLLQFFEAWGLADPVTVEIRRRLSSILFS